MANPFPGVNPFLEAQGFWPDFHHRFITYLGDCLYDLLPNHYEIRMNERVNFLDVSADTSKHRQPDLALIQEPTVREPFHSGGQATFAPVTIPLVIEEESRETYLEIFSRPERNLITVIEVLSPTNKDSSGRTLYLAKHNAVLLQPVHLLEIDLLLGGRRLPLEKDYPPGDYFVLLSRHERRPQGEIYGWPLSSPLPTIPVPLKAPDADVFVDLAALFQLTFQRGRYDRYLNYTEPLPLPLGPENQKWVQALIDNQGK